MLPMKFQRSSALLVTPSSVWFETSIIKWEYGYLMMIAVATPNVTGMPGLRSRPKAIVQTMGIPSLDCAAMPARMKR